MSTEKKTTDELLEMLKNVPERGTVWRHYKTNARYILHHVCISESGQYVLVVYQPFNSCVPFCRPLSEWEEEVEWEGKKVKRFTRE